MNFSEAFKYPYNNLPRVLMITLAFAAYTMVITIFFALILDNFSESSIITHSWIVGTSELLFVGGYGVRLIRSVIHGEEIAPRLKVVEDIGHGIRIFLAFISYTIPLILMYLFSVAVRSITYRTLTREATIVIGGLSLVALALVIPLIFLLGWASQVAMFRYAVKKSGLFEFGTNIRIARQNQGPAFSLSVGLLSH